MMWLNHVLLITLAYPTLINHHLTWVLPLINSFVLLNQRNMWIDICFPLKKHLMFRDQQLLTFSKEWILRSKRLSGSLKNYNPCNKRSSNLILGLISKWGKSIKCRLNSLQVCQVRSLKESDKPMTNLRMTFMMLESN